MDTKDIILKSMGGRLRFVLSALTKEDFEQIEEIRIRAKKPLCIKKRNEEIFLTEQGTVTLEPKKAFYTETYEIQNSLELLSRFSLYAFEEELKNGFITIEGGHRIGVTGKVTTENGHVKMIQNMNALNIRISHEKKGCADTILEYIIKDGELLHTLIISPPGCGKTTLLRDIVRQVSNGKGKILSGKNVGVADERGEIAGCYQGVAQNDVGIRTDVLDSCPKAEGMLLLVRSMSPQVIAADEIGKDEDIYALESIMNSGIRLICTVHGKGIEDILRKPVLGQLLEKNIFQRFIVLYKRKSVGEVEGIYNERFQNIYKKGMN